MGSLGPREEDEAVKRHSYPRPPPSPSAQPWHAGLHPPPHHHHHHHHHIPEWRAHKTVINGTTWYRQAPPRSTVSHIPPPPSPARYVPPFNSVNFDGTPKSQPSPHRHPHAFVHNRGPVAIAFVPPLVRPHAAPLYFNGGASGFSYDEGLRDAQHGIAPGYPYAGTDTTSGVIPAYNGQHQGMGCYPPDGFARPYMPSSANIYGAMPSPPWSHGVLPIPARGYASVQSLAPAQASHGGSVMDYSFNASHGMPPHAIRTAGKTFRQVVTWCGMTMPVTITSQAGAVVEWIQRQTGDLFGFDLEWKPNRLKGEDNLVALLQICGPADCLIVQLLYTEMVPKLLKEFLSNAMKRLGGVGIRQDVNKLERDHDLVCQGQVELGTLASEKLHRDDLQGTGLKKLVDQVLGMTLVKIKKITMSNWEKEDLDDRQIEYACIDAWAAFAILQKLMTLQNATSSIANRL